jgi:hypothetical protein
MKRIACPVCARSVRLVSHGSGRPRKDRLPLETYLGVHRAVVGSEGEASLCPGSGRWMPPPRPVARIVSPLAVALAAKVIGADHHIVRITETGAVCDCCRRVLDVLQWAAPCRGVPMRDPRAGGVRAMS